MKRVRRQYSIQQMEGALNAVKDGIPIMDAARMFKVPRSTLHDKVNEKHPRDATPGQSPILTKDEEKRLVKAIMYLNSVGFIVTKPHVALAVQRFVTFFSKPNPFKKNLPGRHWSMGFLSRNPEVVNSLYPDTLNDKWTLDDWFSRMHAHFHSKKDIFTDRRRVFICDQSSFFWSSKNNQVSVKKDTHKYLKWTWKMEKRECVSLLLSASADGQLIPPSFIYPREKASDKIISNMPETWNFYESVRGSLNGHILYDYITKDFYPKLLERKITFPIIMFMNLSSCYIDLLLYEFCEEKQIILVALLPNTPFLDVLDTAVLRPFTEYCTQKMTSESQNATLVVEGFAKVFGEYLRNGDVSKEIVDEFRACKLCPFGQDVGKMKTYTRHKERSQENNSDVEFIVKIEDRSTEQDVETNEAYVHVDEFSWHGDSGSGPVNESQTENDGTLLKEALTRNMQVNVEERNPNENVDKVTSNALPNKIKLIRQVDGETKRPYFKRIREKDHETVHFATSEPEVVVNVPADKIRDPLETAVPGPSKYNIYSIYEDTPQSDVVLISIDQSQAPPPSTIANRETSEPQLFAELSLDVDIKEEPNVELTSPLETEALADSDIRNVPESDSSSEINLPGARAAEVNSDSSVYFKGPKNLKPKRKMTTELLFRRYKIKSKREIDRLHNKIRELKESNEKYKRQIYRLQRRN